MKTWATRLSIPPFYQQGQRRRNTQTNQRNEKLFLQNSNQCCNLVGQPPFFLSISMPPIKASYLLRILKLSHISTRGPFPKDFSIVSDQFDFRVAHWRSCGLPRTPDLPKPMVIIQLKAEHCKLCVCHFVKCDHRQIYISIFLLSFTCLSIKGSHQQQQQQAHKAR